jgi:hypothetical protein
MWNWLSKAWGATKRVLGKVKSGVEYGSKLFNKGKEVYNGAKNFASNLPFVGEVANTLITNAENSANNYAKEKTGINFSDVNKAVSTAEKVAKYLPKG